MKKNPGRKERRNLARRNKRAEGRLKHQIHIAKTVHKRKTLFEKLRAMFGM